MVACRCMPARTLYHSGRLYVVEASPPVPISYIMYHLSNQPPALHDGREAITTTAEPFDSALQAFFQATRNCQPSIRCAFVISGRRRSGSSTRCGSNWTLDVELQSWIIVRANSSTVCSSGLPRLKTSPAVPG